MTPLALAGPPSTPLPYTLPEHSYDPVRQLNVLDDGTPLAAMPERAVLALLTHCGNPTVYNDD